MEEVAIEILRLTFLMLSKYIQDMSSDQDRSLFPSFISFKPGPLEAYTRPLDANSMEGGTEGEKKIGKKRKRVCFRGTCCNGPPSLTIRTDKMTCTCTRTKFELDLSGPATVVLDGAKPGQHPMKQAGSGPGNQRFTDFPKRCRNCRTLSVS